MRWLLLLPLLWALMACSGVNPELMKEAPDLKPLTPDQEKSWSETLRSTGRLERSVMAQQQDDNSDSILQQMRLLMTQGNCTMTDNLHQGSGLASSGSFVVKGEHCPLTAHVETWYKNDSQKLRGQVFLKKEIAPYVNNSVIGYLVNGTGSGDTDERRYRYDGTLNRIRGPAVSFTGEMKTVKKIHTQSLKFHIDSVPVELKKASDGTQSLFFLNSTSISEEKYQSYFSLLGPLFSGLLNDAG